MIYSTTDLSEYEQISRSVRIHGVVTSVRLERRFWAVLESLCAEEKQSLSNFLSTLHDEVVNRHGEAPNFASLIRVVCATYLANSTEASAA